MKTIYICRDQQSGLDQRAVDLEMAGYDVQSFETGGDLVRAISQEVPDLVLMDVLLDGKNGFEVCQNLDLKGPTDLKVVLFSGVYTRPAFRDLANNLGVVAYVEGSLERGALLAMVHRATRSRGPAAGAA